MRFTDNKRIENAACFLTNGVHQPARPCFHVEPASPAKRAFAKRQKANTNPTSALSPVDFTPRTPLIYVTSRTD
ncbi:hypothetical protein Mal48_42850 [Thalassoglobus polymorphus]|uniref:Uncharacterized protein n=1 Tax=Thalassoglobus polymorphus TaxID=2527994 RepID=A0A517QTS8_9PLAN|nr:hypothetical protein Mal48_42850 [Thalassoglobus polymorphus]